MSIDYKLSPAQQKIVSHLLQFYLMHKDEQKQFSTRSINVLLKRGIIEQCQYDGVIDLSNAAHEHYTKTR